MHLGTPHTREERIAARSTPEVGEARLRRLISATVGQAKGSCTEIQLIVTEVGFAELSAQLGVNAGEIEASYNAIRALAVTFSPGTVIPDLNTTPAV
jgi:hypothetical protein